MHMCFDLRWRTSARACFFNPTRLRKGGILVYTLLSMRVAHSEVCGHTKISSHSREDCCMLPRCIPDDPVQALCFARRNGAVDESADRWLIDIATPFPPVLVEFVSNTHMCGNISREPPVTERKARRNAGQHNTGTGTGTGSRCCPAAGESRRNTRVFPDRPSSTQPRALVIKLVIMGSGIINLSDTREGPLPPVRVTQTG